MAAIDDAGRRFERLVARYFGASLPESEGLPRYVAPLPEWMEDAALRLAWPIVAANLLGTLFGFWYYGFRPVSIGFLPPAPETGVLTVQLGQTAWYALPLVPDSPVATMFIGLSLAAWRLDLDAEWLHALAFFGCIKLGLWTPFVQLIVQGQGTTATWLYQFLIWSHLAMAVEAFLIHRYSDFPVRAVAVAAGWYLLNDVVDYFVPLGGDVHHTWLSPEIVGVVGGQAFLDHSVPAHELGAAGAVTLTVLATFLALSTRVEKVRREA